VLLGEAYVLDLRDWARYYGSGNDELHLAFNFAFLHAPLDAEKMSAVVEATETVLPRGAWPCWTGSNHDAMRLATRWARGDDELARCALLVLAALRGTPVLYYGDELGLTDGEVPPDRVRDIREPPRDPGRTPMPWTDDGGWRDPWLPLVDASRNVERQRRDDDSTLVFTRDLLALRRRSGDLRRGAYASIPSPPGAWAWRRGETTTVAVSLGHSTVRVDGVVGTIELATRRGREGERVDGSLELAAGEGVVVRTG
jgi:alpha-glucosidase